MGASKKSSKNNSLRSALKNGNLDVVRPVESIFYGPWRVDFIRVTRPSNFLKTPIVMLSGMFQPKGFFSQEVELLGEQYPIYKIDLPGFGDNEQASGVLSSKQLAELLARLLDELGIEKAYFLAFSTSSSIAYHFGNHFPERVEKLCFVGATMDYRSSVKASFKDALNALLEDNMDQFATSMVMTLMNHSKKSKVKKGESLVQSFYNQLLGLNEEEKECYVQNISRLLEEDKLGSGPSCPLLVVTGEYDNFTTAYEGHLMIQKCRQGTLAIIKSSDHLVGHEKQTQMINTLKTFFDGDDLNAVRGLKVWERPEFPVSSRRLHPRWKVGQEVELAVELESGESKVIGAVIDEVSVEGCRLKLTKTSDLEIYKGQVLHLKVPIWDFSTELLVFQTSQLAGDEATSECDTALTALFRYNSFEDAEKTEEALEKVLPKVS